MRKLLYITLAAGLFVVSSCEKDLNTSPSTSLPADQAITNIEDLQLAFNGVMQMLSVNRGAYASDFTLYADCKGGDVKLIGDNGQITPLIKYEITKNHLIPTAIYQGFYQPIAFANMALEAGENLGLSTDAYKSLKGQLLAIRAIVHFDIARAYAQLPTLTGVDMNRAGSGIVISDQVFPVNTKFTRATLRETYEFITTELENAIPLMSINKVAGGINQWGAKAILARAYLYMGRYTDAFNTAKDVIENNGGRYSLFTHSNYVASWRLVDASESLCEVYTSDNIVNNPQRNSIGYYCDPNGYAEVAASDDMITLLNGMDLNDIRKLSITQRSTSTGTRTGYYTIKYSGQTNATTPLYTNNPKLIRLAEVYLIAAEAALKGGATIVDALKYYNDLRRSRYAEATYTDAIAITIGDILEERRIELFCEGHRLFDLVRNNLPVTVGTTTRQPNAFDIILPIPQVETDINPDLLPNPGYN